MLTLRPYQRKAVDSLYQHWQGGGGNGLIVIPTGGGKSLVIATIIQNLLSDYPGLRIGVVTHTRELIAQNFKELMRLWPQAPAGIYSAGLNRRDTRARVLFCGIQSVARKVRQIGGIDVLIVDEAHLIPRSSDTLYGRFIRDLREVVHDMRIIGLTATAYRLDTGRLDRGDDKIFDTIVYEANVSDLIRDGYLSPLISKATASAFDLSGVAKRAGEFIPGALAAAVDKEAVTEAAVAEMVSLGSERKAWLSFCVSVDHALNVRDAVRSHGISCETVTGETPAGDRDRIIRDFSAGRIRCLTSVAVLTTGFNVPQVDLIALMRPTLSPGLFVQMVGRAFRLAPGKDDALILDFAGNTKRHGPVDAISVHGGPASKSGAEPEVRAKECPDCQTLLPLSARTCTNCGHEWPAREEPKHEAVADAETPILSTGAPKWIEVSDVRLFPHLKPGSPTSMRVEYTCGFTVHRQWVCFEHEGFARSKAHGWWRRMGGAMPVPETVVEAIDRQSELDTPDEIQVRPQGKFFEIVGFRRRAEVAA